MKNVLFLKVITIFKLFYLFWFKMKQTLPGFCVTLFTSAFASASFSARFPGVGLLTGGPSSLCEFKMAVNIKDLYGNSGKRFKSINIR